MKPNPSKKVDVKKIRCAIYTRKSTEEGLQQEFNTLDAQREAGEAFIAAQKHEGWVCLPDRYDDGGFTGGNLERPAVKRMMADIVAGKIDCVVVYKVDRLSRSLMDFSRMMETFDKQNVSFVSVTQQFNTTHSMGRLTLNILLSFAQFEREIISERTRDKIAAARRKGKFAGGRPVLGYNILSNPTGPKLIINPDEAEQIKVIFGLYLKHQGMIPVAQELNRRGWVTKQVTTKAGKTLGGKKWGKNELFHLLTNVIYIGLVRYQTETHKGEHLPILDEKTWQKVQAVLGRNGRTGGALVRNKHGALLKGLLRCSCCDCSMGHSYSQKGPKRYRYYVCLHAQKRGWDSCPTKSVPAGEIEAFVVDQIKCVGRDPTILAKTIRQVQQQADESLTALTKEQQALQRQLGRYHTDVTKLAVQPGSAGALADLHDRIQRGEERMTELNEQVLVLQRQSLHESEVESALAEFGPVWEALSPQEQARVIHLLIERVDYDGRLGTISVSFRPNGIKAFSNELKEMTA